MTWLWSSHKTDGSAALFSRSLTTSFLPQRHFVAMAVMGDYVVEISGVTISALEIGLANSASGIIQTGLMGLGFDTQKASFTYPVEAEN